MSINSDSTPRHHEAKDTPDERIGHSGHIPVEEGGERAHDPELTDKTPLLDVAHRLQPVDSPEDLDREPTLLPEKKSQKKQKLVATITAFVLTGVGAIVGAKAFASDDEPVKPSQPRPSASAPVVPGVTPSSTSTPSTSETAPTSPDVKLETLAAATTPDKLADMSPEQLASTFSIKLSDVNQTRIAESYFERFVTLYEASANAGMTEKDWGQNLTLEAYDNLVNTKYRTTINKQLFGVEDGQPSEGDRTFYKGLAQRYIDWHFPFIDGTVPKDYSWEVAIEPGSIKVTQPGNGVDGAFVVTGTVIQKEANNFKSMLVKNNQTDTNDPYYNQIIRKDEFTLAGVKADANGILRPNAFTDKLLKNISSNTN